MSIGKVRVFYHPILQKIAFERWENNGWCEINSSVSILAKYFRPEKNKTVILQTLGKEFFDALLEVSGAQKAEIFYQGTNPDYQDFVQMLEQYNNENNCQAFVQPVLGSGPIKVI